MLHVNQEMSTCLFQEKVEKVAIKPHGLYAAH